MKTFTEGTELRDKLTGEVLTCVGDNCAINNNGTEIALRDPVFYEIIKSGTPKDILDGYTVKDGILYKDDSVVTEQGQIKIRKILACMPGRLMLAVEMLRPDEDLVDIFTYTPDEDRFHKLMGAVPVPDVHSLVERNESAVGLYVFVTTRTKSHIVDDGDAERELLEFCGSRMNLYSSTVDKILDYANGPFPIGEPIEIVPDKCDRGVQVICVSADETDYDDEFEMTVVKARQGVLALHRFNIVLNAEFDDSGYASLGAAEVIKLNAEFIDTITACVDDSLLIKANGSTILYYTNDRDYRRVINSPVAEATKGFDTLIEAKLSKDSNLFVLSNNNYETITIKSEKTPDRGIVVTTID